MAGSGRAGSGPLPRAGGVAAALGALGAPAVLLLLLLLLGPGAARADGPQAPPAPRSAQALPPAPSRVRVGVLKLSSSAPVFVGIEKGYFKDAGIDPELVFFQAAQPVAVAVAAGDVEVGATGLTAGLYNVVAGGERIWIVADKGREWPGFPLTALVVQKDGPIQNLRDLRGRKIGLTQLGSTFHYMLGNLLEQEGMTLADVEPAPLRTLGAMAEALQTRRVDAVLIPQPLAGATAEKGFGRILFWVGDRLTYQVAAIFYSKGFAQDRQRAVAFMKGYVRSARHFHDAALARKDGKAPSGPAYDDVVAIAARYTGAPPEVIRVGFAYQDRDGRLDAADVARQVAWYHRAGMVTSPPVLRELVDGSFLDEALRALGP